MRKMLKVKNYFTEDGYGLHSITFKADGLTNAFKHISSMATSVRAANDKYVIENERGEIIAEIDIRFFKR